MRSDLGLLIALAALAPLAPAQEGAASEEPLRSPATLVQIGHWLEVRGALGADGVFRANEAELLPPQKYELLIGTAAEDAVARRFLLLGMPVETDEETEWQGLTAAELPGARLQVEGRWKGARKFSAREISARGAGRHRLGARVDDVREVEGGIEVELMARRVLLPAELAIEHEEPLASYALAPYREGRRDLLEQELSLGRWQDEDDLIPETIRLAEGLYVGGLLEFESVFEDDYDLDRDDSDDREDFDTSLRLRMSWTRYERVQAMVTGRVATRYRFDEDGNDWDHDKRLGETWVAVRDVGLQGLDFLVGRQDFDEPREWIYDEDLDAVRAIWTGGGLRAELSASTVLADGSPVNENSDNYLLYVSNDDVDRHLAAWVLDRRIDLDGSEDYPFFVGVRALGDEWFTDQDVWLDAAYVTGYRDETDLRGWGIDLGTTWSPERLAPFSLTAGWAYGSGDAAPTDETDRNFRQTGFQDNNGKFAGVTSFRYYGELLDPELANLSILTAGVGVELADDTSLDLVLHSYRQAESAPFWAGDVDLEAKPNGGSRDLGWEADLVLGCRRWQHFDLEIAGAWFHPGDAFDDQEDALLGRVQLRYRF